MWVLNHLGIKYSCCFLDTLYLTLSFCIKIIKKKNMKNYHLFRSAMSAATSSKVYKISHFLHLYLLLFMGSVVIDVLNAPSHLDLFLTNIMFS